MSKKIKNVNEQNLREFAKCAKASINSVKEQIASLTTSSITGEGVITSLSQTAGLISATSSTSVSKLSVTDLQTSNSTPTDNQVVNKTHLTAVINGLDSSTKAVSSGFVLSGVTIKNGLITSRTQTNTIKYADYFSSAKTISLSGAIVGSASGGYSGGWSISTTDKSNYLIGALTSLLIGGTAQTVNPSSAAVTKTLTYDFSNISQSQDVEFICCFSPSFGYTYWTYSLQPSMVQLLINGKARHTLTFQYGGMVYIRYTRGRTGSSSSTRRDRIKIWTLGDGSNSVFYSTNSSDPGTAYDEMGASQSNEVSITFTTGVGCYSKYTVRNNKYTE